MAPPKKTTGQFMAELAEKCGGEYVLVGDYQGCVDRHTFRHRVCGAVFTALPTMVLRGRARCPCRHDKTGPAKKTHDEFVAQLRGKRRGYALVGTYIGRGAVHTFRHAKCGTTFTATAEAILRGLASCPCEHKKLVVHTRETHERQVAAKGPYALVRWTGHRDDQLNTYMHVECGRKWRSTYRNFNQAKVGCPHCTGKHGAKINAISREEFVRRLSKVSDEFEVLSYKTASEPATFRHKCRRRFVGRPTDFIRSLRCPACHVKNICRVKTRKVGKKLFRFHGYEGWTLDSLLNHYTAEEIRTSLEYPRFSLKYKFAGVRSTYYPDFYVAKANLVVEVKSMHTLGLQDESRYSFFGLDLFRRMQAKARYVLRRGYRFELHLYRPDGTRVKLPADWHDADRWDRETLAVHVGAAAVTI